MPKQDKKKRIVLWILLSVMILLILIIALPIATLYAQYRDISYVPSAPVDRSDTYVLPEYPEVIPGSEGDTDIPDETDAPEETTEAVPANTEPVEVEPDVSNTEPIPEGTETTELPPETTVTSAPETLPSVINTPAPSTPKYNENNSFANSAKTINVYGKTPIYKVEKKNKDIVNILILGTDSRDVTLDRGRSDTMIILSYNKETGEIKMVSLLRDMLVPIEGYDWNRINTAYFFDGVGLSVNTVNQLFDLDVQHFVVVDLNGAKDFIDYVGGVDLKLSQSEAKEAGVTYSDEAIHLDGAAALRHMRNRTTDNDFGRTERQREVILAVLTKILTEKSLTEILDITKYAMGMVKTNISASTLTSLATSIVGNATNLSVESQSLPYTDAYQFAWYKKMAILTFDIESTAQRMLEFLYE